MASAIITSLVLSTLGLMVSLVLGYLSDGSSDLVQHATLATFTTLVLLLSHSLAMFYLIGKGKAIREAAAEGGLSDEYGQEIARLRKPVFSIGTLAIALTMATAIVGGGVDTRVLPAQLHGLLALSAIAANIVTLRAELAALTASTRLTNEVNRLLDALPAPETDEA